MGWVLLVCHSWYVFSLCQFLRLIAGYLVGWPILLCPNFKVKNYTQSCLFYCNCILPSKGNPRKNDFFILWMCVLFFWMDRQGRWLYLQMGFDWTLVCPGQSWRTMGQKEMSSSLAPDAPLACKSNQKAATLFASQTFVQVYQIIGCLASLTTWCQFS